MVIIYCLHVFRFLVFPAFLYSFCLTVDMSVEISYAFVYSFIFSPVLITKFSVCGFLILVTLKRIATLFSIKTLLPYTHWLNRFISCFARITWDSGTALIPRRIVMTLLRTISIFKMYGFILSPVHLTHWIFENYSLILWPLESNIWVSYFAHFIC